MKLTALVTCTLLSFTSSSQLLTSFFLTAELKHTKGMAALYSRSIAQSSFAFGPGVEMIDISRVGLGGVMPFVDVRYNWRQGKSTVMPLLQGGLQHLECYFS